ncbi:uncharacterized protein N7473_001716 [Penicillium subrubescens]|uniref:uncharacterized protein n=1 Tax=Penicillium subrubescens TaxID=1316194 RepID=UPI0025454C86|nr:uncharacterized protein N7473_004437 [Penicillium subrubescens]XP_057011195.1 uncharacterized protein N7473_001601 [Penicillium subrubescens]XP_057011310.1 uncharacterized protein N7473_001716 [Penicillium subrubescens]KAJ5900367.1 hypothetical protein N7473_004437 [Penicillium subrubescens]KAJ5904685.1 hypothetical protein N7473_001601 [Penicillium subrubescens]KAJ5904800.1 hypothetical protein N7473_001716 [Penicillium subrubescens]
MRPFAAVLAISLLAAPAAADWELYTSTCYGFSGSYMISGGAFNGDPCSTDKGAHWDNNYRERRMDSYNPCNREGKKLRYVRDGSDYNVYWEDSPNNKIGRCYEKIDPDRTAVCHDIRLSCSYSLMYECKSPVCTSEM